MPIDPEAESAQSELEERNLRSNGVLVVDGRGVEAPPDSIKIDGMRWVAELSLGGHAGYPAQKVNIFRIEDFQGTVYSELARRAEEAGVEPTDYYMYVPGTDVIAGAGAFVPETKQIAPNIRERMPVLGRNRQGDIRWFEYGVDHERDPKWTPFEKNESISREQFQVAIDVTNKTIVLINKSENSNTKIKGRFIETGSYGVDIHEAKTRIMEPITDPHEARTQIIEKEREKRRGRIIGKLLRRNK